jgi:uncharacterized protein (TIGR03032 family)
LQSALTRRANSFSSARKIKIRWCSYARPFKNYGLAFDGERRGSSCKESVIIYSSSPLLAKAYPRQPNIYDTIFLPRAQYFYKLTDTHDLVWTDEKLLMVNTRFSCLAWLDHTYNFLPFWQPPFITELMRRIVVT